MYVKRYFYGFLYAHETGQGVHLNPPRLPTEMNGSDVYDCRVLPLSEIIKKKVKPQSKVQLITEVNSHKTFIIIFINVVSFSVNIEKENEMKNK